MVNDEQKKRLAEAALQLARVIAGKQANNATAKTFADALFECPREAIPYVPALVEKLCSREELPDIVRALDDFERVKAEPAAAAPAQAEGSAAKGGTHED